MSNRIESLEHMLAAWNETDPALVRAHLDKALSPEITFIDPSIETRGIDEFEANVHGVHEQLPNAVYRLVSGIDRHHDVVRYAWEIRQDGELIVPGFDVTELDGDGRVLRVLGFFGPLPDAEAS